MVQAPPKPKTHTFRGGRYRPENAKANEGTQRGYCVECGKAKSSHIFPNSYLRAQRGE